jgi:hypothetical protein
MPAAEHSEYDVHDCVSSSTTSSSLVLVMLSALPVQLARFSLCA